MTPNKPLELTPLRVEQGRPDFENQIWFDAFSIYRGGVT
jgi:hypothetical protein